MKSGKTGVTNKKVSIAPNNVSDIQPVVYSFRILGDGPVSGSVMTAIRPPNWLYQDHALGVVWMLFHDDKNYIGITQLHWCLRFLLDLKNSRGEYTGDVNICIQAIQDALIERYAKLGTAMEKSVKEKSVLNSKNGKVLIEPNVSAIREENESISMEQENDTTNLAMSEPIDSTNGYQEEITEREEENLTARTTRRKSGTSTPRGEEPDISIIHEETVERTYSDEHCNPTRCGISEKIEKQEEVVSFTYNEMISRGPEPCTEEHSIEDSFDESIYYDASNKTTKEIIQDDDRDKKYFADTSTKEMVNYLNSSRQQHIERIKKEIERLYGLERFMENLDTNGFSAYVTEDLARRMKSLKNEDVIKGVDEIIR